MSVRKRLALCVGINDYPGSGNDLSGCVNDAEGWAALLDSLDYEVVKLLDEDATKYVVAAELRNAMHDLRFGDRFVFTYSGHGSWVRDANADERDGRDECLVLHDWQNAGLLTDDDLFAIYQQRRYGVRVTAISDSCHSGTVARFVSPCGAPRFFPPELLDPVDVQTAPRRRAVGRPDTVLMSGCDDLEYSYDAWIDGAPQGAFSHAALATFAEGQSMQVWHQRIRAFIDTDAYPQHPQLQATSWQRYWKL